MANRKHVLLEETEMQFSQMGLDERLLDAITKMKWKEPTPIQSAAIPYFLSGRDLLAKARTGSGKTGAFLIPLVQKILDCKPVSLKQCTKALIISPSKELCKQIGEVLRMLTEPIKREVKYVDLSTRDSLNAQKPFLLENPDIVIGTPSKVLGHIKEKNLKLEVDLQFLIIDEADLIYAYEHQEDMLEILENLPPVYQSFLTSATIGEDVLKLKKIVLNKPKILKLEEAPLPTASQLSQYVMKLEEVDKAVLVQSLFSLNLIRGKTLLFVKSVDKGYRLRMFLEQFNITACVLNSEMPAASRCNIVDQFNKGVYSVIIATDEQTVNKPTEEPNKKNRQSDKESGVARGIDFMFVANIINFDFPESVDDYVHRVGRTARGSNMGTALSLVSRKEMPMLHAVEQSLAELMPEEGKVLKDFQYDMDQLDGFKYRAVDAWRRCTRIAIKDVRKKEIRQELLNSDKLKRYFKENPRDFDVLRHDIKTKVLKKMEHLKHIPEYNIPEKLRLYSKRKRPLPEKVEAKILKKRVKADKKKEDPLRTLKFTGLTKTKK